MEKDLASWKVLLMEKMDNYKEGKLLLLYIESGSTCNQMSNVVSDDNIG